MIDIKVEWEGGDDDFERVIMEQIAENVRDVLAGVRCPEHGEEPVVKLVMKGETPSVDVGGCCDQFQAVVVARIEQGMGPDDAGDA